MGLEQPKSARAEAMELMEERTRISDRIDALVSLLTEGSGPGLHGNLLTEDGFPRADIDIVAVRTQRNELAVLRTEHAQVEEKLYAALQRAIPRRHDASSSDANAESTAESESAEESTQVQGTAQRVAFTEGENSTSNATGPSGAQSGSAMEVNRNGTAHALAPFASVDQVFQGSPASTAGICVGDRIISFGDVSLSSSRSAASAMQALLAVLRANENRPIPVVVQRPNSTRLTLTITPRRWSGMGLLGCHVMPMQVQEDQRYRPDVATAAMQRQSHAPGPTPPP